MHPLNQFLNKIDHLVIFPKADQELVSDAGQLKCGDLVLWKSPQMRTLPLGLFTTTIGAAQSE